MADGEGVYGPTEHTEQRLPRVRRRSQWEGPNEEFMKMLLDLGISKNAAEKVQIVAGTVIYSFRTCQVICCLISD